MKSFQMSPVRWFSIMTTIGAWFSPIKMGDTHRWSRLIASRKPYTPHSRSPRSR